MSNRIYEIFERFLEKDSDPKTELVYSNNFQLLIAVILSARCTDRAVNIATSKFFAKVKTPEAMLSLGEEELIGYIKNLGLFRSKSKHIIELCKILVDRFNSEVPDSFDDLISLPGVGRKTANVVLNCGFGVSTIAVDTHIFRLSRRLGLSNGRNVDAVERDLMEKIPEKFKLKAHLHLILHGRYVCKAVRPRCDVCFISDLCPSHAQIAAAKDLTI